jgi:hypothetical protein
MSGREKFAWYEDMNHDEKIPLAQRAVIGYCGIRYAKAPRYLIEVRQQTIAEHLSIRKATVNAAFRSGAQRGWLRKVAVGQRGRGHHGADIWELTTPGEMVTPDAPIYDEMGARNDGNEYAKPHEWVRETAEMGTRPNAPTSENDTPKGTDKGTKEGFLDKGVSAFGAANARTPARPREEHLEPDIIDAEVVDDDAALAHIFKGLFDRGLLDGRAARDRPGGEETA